MLSFAISRARAAARHAWKRGLVLRAAGGDWQAKKQLTKRDSLHAAMWPMLMAHEGDKHAVVREVAQHFACKFACDAPLDVGVTFQGVPEDELPFTVEEVVEGVQSMTTHKTTGATKMSVELFQCLTEYEQGSRCLRDVQDAQVDSHILALQECSLPKGDDGCAPPGDDNNPVACDVAHGYVVLVGKPSRCHRKLAFCVDESWGAVHYGVRSRWETLIFHCSFS